MLSSEIKQLASIARQFRGLFVGLDKLADAVDELDRRDAEISAREAALDEKTKT